MRKIMLTAIAIMTIATFGLVNCDDGNDPKDAPVALACAHDVVNGSYGSIDDSYTAESCEDDGFNVVELSSIGTHCKIEKIESDGYIWYEYRTEMSKMNCVTADGEWVVQ
jgi:hypothetical protein